MWKGIDVSDNQGIIDWKQVKAAGVQFAILRSVRRSGKEDYQFSRNLAGCQQNGIPVAVYKYTYAVNETQAMEEAQQVVAMLRKYSLQNTMVWWDVEDRDTLQGLGSTRLTACIQTARVAIQNAGYRFGLYTGLNVWKEKWFDFNRFSVDPLWMARYYKGYELVVFSDIPDQKYKPDINRALWGWQHTSTGRVQGINGNVDLDICYQNSAEPEEPVSVPGAIYCVSVADVWDKSAAQAVTAVYPGCVVHKAQVLDAGGMEIWIASIADVWTQEQAEVVQQQLARIGISGVIHRVKILE